MKRVAVYYPVEAVYYVHPEHPNCAVMGFDTTGINDYINNVYLFFDLNGNLTAVAKDDDDLATGKDKLLRLICMQDFKANKYNVRFEDELTRQYIELVISGEWERLRQEAGGTLMAKQFWGHLNQK